MADNTTALESTTIQDIGGRFRVQATGPAADVPEVTGTPLKDELSRGGRVRFLFNTETGETEIQRSNPAGAVVSIAPSAEKASALNNQGMPISLPNVGPKDIVTLPGLGDSTAQVYEQMGLLRRLPTGGYEVVGEAVTATAPKPDEQKPVNTEADMRGVKGTSEQTDAFIKTAESKTSAGFVAGVMTTMAKNNGEVPDQMIVDTARQMGVESSVVRQQIERAHSEFVEAGETVARNAGVSNEDMARFAAETKASSPDKWNEAVQALATERNLGPIAELARTWVKKDTAATVTSLERAGLKTWQDSSNPGTIFIKAAGLVAYGFTPRYKGQESVTFAEAVANGWITLS